MNALTTIDTTPGTYTVNITADITLTAGTTLPGITGSTNNITDRLAFEAAYHTTPPTGNTLSQTISLGLDYKF